MKPANKRILYVEDDADDRDFFYDAIQTTHPELIIHTAMNGQNALEYLQDAAARNDLPNLVVLDINLPVFDGKELMEKLKTHPALQQLPVVIFTSSESPSDKVWANAMGFSLYNKPYDLAIMPSVIEDLLTFMR